MSDKPAPYPVWPFWNLNRTPPSKASREITEQDKAVQRAISLPNQDGKRYGHGQFIGERE